LFKHCCKSTLVVPAKLAVATRAGRGLWKRWKKNQKKTYKKICVFFLVFFHRYFYELFFFLKSQKDFGIGFGLKNENFGHPPYILFGF